MGTNEEIREIWSRFVDTLGMTPAEASRWMVDQGLRISPAGVRGWFGLDVRAPSAPRDPEVSEMAARLVAQVLDADSAQLLTALWEARRAIQKVNRSDMSELDALFNLGVLYDARSAPTLAEKWYRHAARYGHTMAMNNLGVLNQEQGHFDDAESWYLRACDTGNSTSMSNLAVLYRALGELAKAEEWLRKASELGNERATNNLAALYLELGEEEKAEEWLAQHATAG